MNRRRTPESLARGAQAAPLIGVTGPDRGGYPAWLFARCAVRRAGGSAVRITPSTYVSLQELHGLVLGGGADVTEPLPDTPDDQVEPNPQRRWFPRFLDDALAILLLLFRFLFGTRRHGADAGRDALEIALLKHAMEHHLPVLGICRGAQIMNVAEGGTLMRHVREFYEERPDLYTVLPRRKVALASSSRLARIVGADTLSVNSLHFHAVRDAAPGLRIVARETSGVPQAVEHPGRTFWIGVQWHPEYLPQRERHQRLFHALVDCARRSDAERRREFASGEPDAVRAVDFPSLSPTRSAPTSTRGSARPR